MSTFNTGHQRGGFTKVITITPTIQAAAYASGDVIGGKQELLKAGRDAYASGTIQSITISSEIAFTQELDIFFFNADPTNTTVTENGAVAIAAADAAKLIGCVSLVSSSDDYADGGTPDVLTKVNIGLPFEINADTRSIFAIAVVRGAHTPGSTDELVFKYGILQD